MSRIQQIEPVSVDIAVAGLARLQHGVLSRAQLDRLGVTARQTQVRLERNALRIVVPGVYALASAPPNFEQTATAVLLDAGPGAVIAGRWAAAWWELVGVSPRNTPSPVDILVPSSHRALVANARVTRTKTLDRTDVTDMTAHQRDVARLQASERRRKARGGLLNVPRGMDRPRAPDVASSIVAVALVPQVTTPARTLVDLMRTGGECGLAETDIERMVDDALSSHLVSASDLESCAGRAAPPRIHGRAMVLGHLRRISGDYLAPDSELERVALAAFEEWRCPVPRRQATLPGRSTRPGQVDFAWPDRNVIVEVDGRGHLSEEQVEADRARDRAALIAGWRPFRFGWADFHRHRARTRKEVRSILGLR